MVITVIPIIIPVSRLSSWMQLLYVRTSRDICSLSITFTGCWCLPSYTGKYECCDPCCKSTTTVRGTIPGYIKDALKLLWTVCLWIKRNCFIVSNYQINVSTAKSSSIVSYNKCLSCQVFLLLAAYWSGCKLIFLFNGHVLRSLI